MLSTDNIARAAATIDAAFTGTPQFTDPALNAAVGAELWLKLETLNPIRSFKGRGVDFYMRQAEPGREIVCASAGNFGQAVAYCAAAADVRATVFCATTANARKVARIRELGAELVPIGDDFDEAKEAARKYAAESETRIFVEDGAEAAIAEGAGSIAVELTDLELDTLLVPVGNGALICGIGHWIKANDLPTRVIGVCAAGAPAMARSWRAGRPLSGGPVNTIADGVAVREPVPEAVAWMATTVDDVLEVDEAEIRESLALVRDTVGMLVEPSAVLGVAAARRIAPTSARLGTIVTGSNFSDTLLRALVTGGGAA